MRDVALDSPRLADEDNLAGDIYQNVYGETIGNPVGGGKSLDNLLDIAPGLWENLQPDFRLEQDPRHCSGGGQSHAHWWVLASVRGGRGGAETEEDMDGLRDTPLPGHNHIPGGKN